MPEAPYQYGGNPSGELTFSSFGDFNGAGTGSPPPVYPKEQSPSASVGPVAEFAPFGYDKADSLPHSSGASAPPCVNSASVLNPIANGTLVETKQRGFDY